MSEGKWPFFKLVYICLCVIGLATHTYHFLSFGSLMEIVPRDYLIGRHFSDYAEFGNSMLLKATRIIKIISRLT